MSTAAVMLVKDEADTIEHTIRHLLTQVDAIIVADNLSTDGTWDRLRDLAHAYPHQLTVGQDDEVAYYQSRKTTELALMAYKHGHDWVLPCDADEIWTAPPGYTIAKWAAGFSPTIVALKARLYDHHPTSIDDEDDPNPFRRVGWRTIEPIRLPKYLPRTDPGLTVGMGNHEFEREDGQTLCGGDLMVHHHPWRSPEQYVRKIRNGTRAYAATDLPATYGNHWRMMEGKTDEELTAWYHEKFYIENPAERGDLCYDPVDLP